MSARKVMRNHKKMGGAATLGRWVTKNTPCCWVDLSQATRKLGQKLSQKIQPLLPAKDVSSSGREQLSGCDESASVCT